MYKPKRHVRLDAVRGLPKMSNMRTLLSEARNAKGCTVELPWKSTKTDTPYSMTVRVEISGGEPIWTLYEGEGSSSRVMWSSPFEDLDLLYDVVCLSLPADVSNGFGDDFSHSDADSLLNAPDPTMYSVPRPAMENESFLLKEEDFQRPRPAKPSQSAPARPDPVQPAVAQPAAAQTAPAQPAPAQPAPAQPNPAHAAQPIQPGQPTQQGQPTQPGQPNPAAIPPGYAQPPYPGYPPPPGYPPGYVYPPGYAPPQYGYPAGYGYPAYPPGYAAPPQVYIDPRTGYPYPPYPQPAQTVPMQQGVPYSPPTNPPPQAPIDADLLKKRPNVLLGSFLVEAGLIPDTTLKAALQLQDLVRSGNMSTTKAAEAVRRAHNRGGAVEQAMFSASAAPGPNSIDVKAVAPPLGQILVEAGLISVPVLKAALNLQEVVRNGAMTKESAVEAFIQEHFGKSGKHGTSESPEAVRAIDLVKQAGLLQEQDFQAAVKVKVKHGGETAKILAAAGKMDLNTYNAALKCIQLMEQNRLKIEQAMIALHYCQRSRVSFDDAVDEMGWEKP